MHLCPATYFETTSHPCRRIAMPAGLVGSTGWSGAFISDSIRMKLLDFIQRELVVRAIVKLRGSR